MIDWKKESFITDIERKLCNCEPLDGDEIHCIIAALRRESGCLIEPYYEVVYHDEYGRVERRVMNPTYSSCKEEDSYYIKSDRFEIGFNRIIPK